MEYIKVNSNILTANTNENVTLTSNNTVNKKKLESIIKKNIKTEYNDVIGELNDLYNSKDNCLFELPINQTLYYIKTIPLTRLNYTSNTNNIKNIKDLQLNANISKYLFMYKYLLQTKDALISIFEKEDNYMTLREYIVLLKHKTNKYAYTRYLIISLLNALTIMHKSGVCHLNINGNSILIRENPLFNMTTLYSEEPLFIKFINFNLNYNKKIQKRFISANELKPLLDPYLRNLHDTHQNDNKYLSHNTQYMSYKNCIKYDVWCMSLIILRIILLENLYKEILQSYISNGFILVNTNNNELYLNDKRFLKIYNNIIKYGLCSLNERKNIDFIFNIILLSEQHD